MLTIARRKGSLVLRTRRAAVATGPLFLILRPADFRECQNGMYLTGLISTLSYLCAESAFTQPE